MTNPTTPHRWYSVSSCGLALLCVDEQNARDAAAESDVSYPRRAPHRAVLLGDVAAERGRIAAAVTRCTLLAENCEGDSPEVDTARKSLACTILAAIAGYEAPSAAGDVLRGSGC